MTLKITNSFKFPKATLLFFKAAVATNKSVNKVV